MYRAVVHTTRGGAEFEFCNIEEWEKFFDAEFLKAMVKKEKERRRRKGLEWHDEHFCPEAVSHVIFSTISGRDFDPEELAVFGITTEGEGDVVIVEKGDKKIFYVDGSVRVDAPDCDEKEKEFERWWLSITM